jgi:hypothetical protein
MLNANDARPKFRIETRPYTTTKPDEQHYFVEFLHQEGVDRARRLSITDVQVLILDGTSPLVQEYNSVVEPTRLPETKRDLTTFPGLTLDSTSITQQGKPHRVDSLILDKYPAQASPGDLDTTASPLSIFSPLSIPQRPLPSPTAALSVPLTEQLKPCRMSISTRCAPRDGSSIPPTASLRSPPPRLPLLISTSKVPAPTPNQLPTPVSPTRPLPSVSEMLFSLETRLEMSLCGEPIVYDLKTLEDDPQAIIDLLKVTASERGSWMIVACHYRRKFKVAAAISVMTSMLEGATVSLQSFIITMLNILSIVMEGNGVSDIDLKPAFLMLSSCETELARRTAKSNSKLSAEHASKSTRWLQKVYGFNSPSATPPVAANALGLDFPDKVPVQPRAPTPGLGKAIPDRPRHKLLAEARKATPPVAPDSSSSNSSHMQVLQREIEALRDKQSANANLISNIRSSKRKLEDELSSERSTRRKLEISLEDVKQDLRIAKKMEGFALQQVKKEVDTRRKAEARVEAEKEKRKEAEKALESRAVKPLLEDLANMFQRAAKGDGTVFSGLTGGSSRSSSKRS